MDERTIYDQKKYKISGDQLKNIQPLVYRNRTDDKLAIGISAQELASIEPLLVRVNTDGSLRVDYEKLTVVLLATIHDLNDRILSLENNLNSKKKTNAKL